MFTRNVASQHPTGFVTQHAADCKHSPPTYDDFSPTLGSSRPPDYPCEAHSFLFVFLDEAATSRHRPLRSTQERSPVIERTSSLPLSKMSAVPLLEITQHPPTPSLDCAAAQPGRHERAGEPREGDIKSPLSKRSEDPAASGEPASRRHRPCQADDGLAPAAWHPLLSDYDY